MMEDAVRSRRAPPGEIWDLAQEQAMRRAERKKEAGIRDVGRSALNRFRGAVDSGIDQARSAAQDAVGSARNLSHQELEDAGRAAGRGAADEFEKAVDRVAGKGPDYARDMVEGALSSPTARKAGLVAAGLGTAGIGMRGIEIAQNDVQRRHLKAIRRHQENHDG